jgi:leader peptidase (prepilin peptidase) / N-methyltransferase
MQTLKDILQLYASIPPIPLLVLGLLLGSFLNVVGIRIPLKQSITHPPSHCPHCNHRLGPFDLVPVFSWLLLRGRCRYCKAPVSPIYMVGEAVTGLLFGLMAWQLGATLELIPALLLVSILVAITVSDLRYMLIPDRIVFFGCGCALFLRLFVHPLPLWNYVLAFLVGGGVLYAIAWLSEVLLKKEGMGGGDIKLFGFIGLILGIKLTLLTLFTASVLGTFYGVMLILAGRYRRDQPMPFGPFIAIGAILTYLWGNDWLEWYMNMLQ